MLKALSNRVTSSKLLAYCVANGPRPKLSVGPAVGYPGRRVSHFYGPAIKKYGYLLDHQYLEKAYARAQMFFTGIFRLFVLCLALFLVLTLIL